MNKILANYINELTKIAYMPESVVFDFFRAHGVEKTLYTEFFKKAYNVVKKDVKTLVLFDAALTRYEELRSKFIKETVLNINEKIKANRNLPVEEQYNLYKYFTSDDSSVSARILCEERDNYIEDMESRGNFARFFFPIRVYSNPLPLNEKSERINYFLKLPVRMGKQRIVADDIVKEATVNTLVNLHIPVNEDIFEQACTSTYYEGIKEVEKLKIK